jgi:hypothetical protein
MMNAAARRSLIILGICVLLFSGCRTAYNRAILEGQQNLEPEAGKLAGVDDRYDRQVLSLFIKGYEQDVIFRMICIPSFTPEWLVGIRKTEGKYTAFILRPEKHIWREFISRESSNDAEIGKHLSQIPVNEKSEAIDAETAELLSDVWSAMLLSVRHPRERNCGHDGTIYHFSMEIPKRGTAGGTIWEPSPDTRTGLLSSLGELIAVYIDASPRKKQEILKEINHKAKALRKRL